MSAGKPVQQADCDTNRRHLNAANLIRALATGHVGFTMSINLVLMVCSLLSGSLAAHLLGPTGRGQLAAIQLWPLVIMTVGSGGIVEAVSYYSGRHPHESGVFGMTAAALLAALAVPLVLIGIVAMPVLLAAEPSRIVVQSQIYMLILPILFFINLPLAIVRGRGEIHLWNVLRLTQPVGYIVILLCAFFVGGNRVTFVTFAMFGWLVAHLAISIWLFRRRLPGPHRFEGARVRPLLRYGGLSISATTPSWLNSRLDQLVMGAFLAPRLLGLYAVGVSWSYAVTPVSNAFAQVILPRLAGTAETSVAVQHLAVASRTAVAVNALMGLGFLLLTPPAVIVLFGASFAPAIPATLVLVAAAVCLGMNQFLEEAVRGLGQPALATMAELMGLLMTVASLALLLPRLGILGAAFASLLSYATILSTLVTVLHRRLGVAPRALLVPRPAEIRLALREVGSRPVG